MLTIKCTKSCPWGVHHAWGPTFQIEPGMVLNTEDYPDTTNAADWKAFFQKLLEEGHAEIIPNEELAEVKEDDNTSDSSEGDAEENADNASTSEDDAGDTEDDSTSNQDTENTDESIDEAADDQGGSEEKTTEPTPETLKSELEGIALKEMDGPMGSEQKAKAALEAIGKERYGFDADKRKTVDGIIEAIVEAAFKVE